ncbi:MAG: DUF983 domain-containing protein [Chitinophagaceae bacterium]|nr:DUF983 domain-containing protein [Chitinophagaceae bacterium]
MTKKERKPGYLRSLLLHKCSRCRTGDMFQVRSSYNLKQFMKMNDKCPVCGQHLEIEVGFYYGTSYVSYALTVALSVATCIAWWVLIGFSLEDNRFFLWMGFNMIALLVAQPYLMRLSRAIWLSFFVRYNENWRNEKPEEPERRGSRAEN